jgi:hypothetical protein
MNQLKKLEIKNLNHLGIIAGIIDEIGIVEIINDRLGTDKKEIVNSGIIISRNYSQWIRICRQTTLSISTVF